MSRLVFSEKQQQKKKLSIAAAVIGALKVKRAVMSIFTGFIKSMKFINQL